MKFIKYFLVGFLFLAVPSISQASSVIKIIDSSALNLNKVNSLTAITEESQNIPLGTVIAWENSTYHSSSVSILMPAPDSPNTERCALKSSITYLPRCKWIPAQSDYSSTNYVRSVDSTLYPEYVAEFGKSKNIPPVGGWGVPYGRVGIEVDPMKQGYGIGTMIHGRIEVEVDIAKNNDHIIPGDGPREMRIGQYGIRTDFNIPRIDKPEQFTGMGESTYINNQSRTFFKTGSTYYIGYYVRVAN